LYNFNSSSSSFLHEVRLFKFLLIFRQLRIRAIEELARITKKDGLLLIYVWAMEQENLKVTQQDVLVPWNLQAKYESEKKLTDLFENEAGPQEEPIKKEEVSGEPENKETDILMNEGKKTLVYKRYYHMFKKGELEELVGQVPGLEVQESYYDNDNWCVILKKKL
jgi:alkylated DNA repair protein alkB family protein 8